MKLNKFLWFFTFLLTSHVVSFFFLTICQTLTLIQYQSESKMQSTHERERLERLWIGERNGVMVGFAAGWFWNQLLIRIPLLDFTGLVSFFILFLEKIIIFEVLRRPICLKIDAFCVLSFGFCLMWSVYVLG